MEMHGCIFSTDALGLKHQIISTQCWIAINGIRPILYRNIEFIVNNILLLFEKKKGCC